jgi:hypothetical protein
VLDVPDSTAFERSNVEEKQMRKFSVVVAAALLLGVTNSADAMVSNAPAGLRAAIAETTTTQKITWGWGGYYSPVYVAPPVYVVRPVVVVPPVYAPVFWRPRPYFWGGPRFYGARFYGRRFYGW